MPEAHISFPSHKLTLEGIFFIPNSLPGPYPCVVACHPHPFLGGAMQNPVIVAICRALAQDGIATLRFNFRGIGESGGEFTNGKEEHMDLPAALRVAQSWPGIASNRVGMVGFSFGASMILQGIKGLRGVKAFAFLSPPLGDVERTEVAKDSRPKLFVAGERDRVVAAQELAQKVGARPKTEFSSFPNADHSWRGQELQVALQVSGFFSRTL